MNRSLSVIALCLIALAAGCKRYTYHVNLRPLDEGLERSVVIDRGSQPGGKPAAPSKPTVQAILDATPDDIGGAGSYHAYPTSLGTLHVYVERFRGDDNVLGQWDRQMRALDAFVDLLLTWIDARFAHEAGVEKLRAFADTSLRRDLKNAAMYAWLTTAQQSPDQRPGSEETLKRNERLTGDLIARLGQYAVEHGYLDPRELPTLARLLEASHEDNGRAALGLFRRQLLLRIGRDVNDPAFNPPDLADAVTASSAFREHVRGSAAARERLAAWARDANADANPEHWEEQLDQLSAAAIRLPLLANFDELDMSLACPERPFATNGAWDQTAGRVTWAGTMEVEPKDAVGLPLMAYAAWSTPNAQAQRERFGIAALSGERLGAYCLWRCGLSADEAAQWDAFLSTLKPDAQDAAPRLRAFRFKGRDESAPSGPGAIADALTAPAP